MRILQGKTAAVIIDVQSRLFAHMSRKERLTKNICTLVYGLQELGLPILVAQQYTKGLGDTIPEVASALGDFAFTEKISFSCCDNPSFVGELSQLDKKWILVAGIEAHVCVLQTTEDLLQHGYTPVVVEDCISSRHENDRRVALMRMSASGAVLSSVESILFELCRKAGTETFRSISRLVK